MRGQNDDFSELKEHWKNQTRPTGHTASPMFSGFHANAAFLPPVQPTQTEASTSFKAYDVPTSYTPWPNTASEAQDKQQSSSARSFANKQTDYLPEPTAEMAAKCRQNAESWFRTMMNEKPVSFENQRQPANQKQSDVSEKNANRLPLPTPEMAAKCRQIAESWFRAMMNENPVSFESNSSAFGKQPITAENNDANRLPQPTPEMAAKCRRFWKMRAEGPEYQHPWTFGKRPDAVEHNPNDLPQPTPEMASECRRNAESWFCSMIGQETARRKQQDVPVAFMQPWTNSMAPDWKVNGFDPAAFRPGQRTASNVSGFRPVAGFPGQFRTSGPFADAAPKCASAQKGPLDDTMPDTNKYHTRSTQMAAFTPRMDYFDTPRAFLINVSLPGAKREDCSLTYDAKSGAIKVQGRIRRPSDADTLDLNMLTLGERAIGSFERKIWLRELDGSQTPVDYAAMTAKMEDGVLVVRVPKISNTGNKKLNTVNVDIE